ncbi:MAG: hypothetical protein ACAH59_07515 [Pseudobdellovibrionaceae bacterium]
MILHLQSKGQSTVEAVVYSAALMAFTLLLMSVIYLCFLKTKLRFTSHEFLVCREISNPWLCQNKFQKELESAFRFGKMHSLWARKQGNQQILNLKMKFQILSLRTVTWDYQDQIEIPLKSK